MTTNEVKPNFDKLAREAFPDLNHETIDKIAFIGERGYTFGSWGWYKEGEYGSDADYCNGIGARIQRLESELSVDDGSIHDFFVECHGNGLIMHSRVCNDPDCCPANESDDEQEGEDRPKIKLDDMDRDDGSVLVTMACRDAGRIVKDRQSIQGSLWEAAREDPDFAYAVISDAPDLVSQLESEGYDVKTDEYTPMS